MEPKKPASKAHKPPSADDPSLEQKLQSAQEELMKLREIAARAQADLQNARARLEREAKDIREFAFEGVLRKLLPTVENLRRAFNRVPDALREHEWVKGIQVLEQALLKDLADLGLTRMEPLSKPTDPMRHEVLQAGPGQKDVVTEVFEDGYEFRGKVLRPAKVKAGDGTSLPS